MGPRRRLITTARPGDQPRHTSGAPMRDDIPEVWPVELDRIFRANVREIFKDKTTKYISEFLLAYKWSIERGKTFEPLAALFYDEINEIMIDRIVTWFAVSSIPDYHLTHYERRLALTVWALRDRFVASDIHCSLPEKPGMASAHAFATIYSDPERYLPEGTYRQSEGAYSLQGPQKVSDPVANGVRWLTRLRRDVSQGEDRGEFISQLLHYLDHTIEMQR